MSYWVEFAPEALAQLAAIEKYIANASAPAAAIRYVDAIVAYCEGLVMFPERRTKRDDLLPGLRISHYSGTAVIAFMVDAKRESGKGCRFSQCFMTVRTMKSTGAAFERLNLGSQRHQWR